MKDKMGNILSSEEISKKVFNRFYSYYLDFKVMLLGLVGYVPFHCFRNFCYRLSGIKIGKGSTIHMGARFFQPKNISIGKDTIIGDHCFLDGRDSLKIGDHVAIASQVLIYNSQHDVHSDDFKPVEKPVEIGDYCFIGARVIILPGVKIGRGAVVGSGAVVTKDIPEMTVVGGVPAREIKKRGVSKLKYRLGRARLFQ
ncbi:acyltransferase [Candidatus Beckwithbacteria bacterium CG10_big_fil_rev_8_21_14_0_10_34_10]|uniref:Acyltransferase n=1 Tax=Candidatus Beckwithbacteria bacterium CG10_big_fil_rev_8_21_14_0_10_34_10 TaxID=1974495 RepID=A0A2H0W939_9BACT|nr:MAG: acyltransferase [Candidatus Beckwithbacteria bacterium CG10_big_fil_rev_8_21_14_0_10_34_10]